MIISLSFIPGVMVGFEWVTDIETEEDLKGSYVVLDLLIFRLLIEY